MNNRLMPRAKDPKWLAVCQMWDLLTEGQQQIVTLAMQEMADQNKEKGKDNESEAKAPSSGQV